MKKTARTTDHWAAALQEHVVQRANTPTPGHKSFEEIRQMFRDQGLPSGRCFVYQRIQAMLKNGTMRRDRFSMPDASGRLWPTYRYILVK